MPTNDNASSPATICAALEPSFHVSSSSVPLYIALWDVRANCNHILKNQPFEYVFWLFELSILNFDTFISMLHTSPVWTPVSISS